MEGSLPRVLVTCKTVMEIGDEEWRDAGTTEEMVGILESQLHPDGMVITEFLVCAAADA